MKTIKVTSTIGESVVTHVIEYDPPQENSWIYDEKAKFFGEALQRVTYQCAQDLATMLLIEGAKSLEKKNSK